MKVALFMGSESDLDIALEAVKIFREFEIPYTVEVTSAHRSPERTASLVQSLQEAGVEVFITCAGKAAHLGGVVAAHTVRPVIGVPVGGQTLGGLDALLSTVQMPQGVPVACMGIGKAGAANAALLAIQILSLKDNALQEKLEEHRKKMIKQVEESGRRVKMQL